MIALAPASRRVRRRGQSFLTHGGDNYDHRTRNKAVRRFSAALIEEGVQELTAVDPPQQTYKWVVNEYFEDGDKPWLSDWFPTGMFDKFDDAEASVVHRRPEDYDIEYREVRDWELDCPVIKQG